MATEPNPPQPMTPERVSVLRGQIQQYPSEYNIRLWARHKGKTYIAQDEVGQNTSIWPAPYVMLSRMTMQPISIMFPKDHNPNIQPVFGAVKYYLVGEFRNVTFEGKEDLGNVLQLKVEKLVYLGDSSNRSHEIALGHPALIHYNQNSEKWISNFKYNDEFFSPYLIFEQTDNVGNIMFIAYRTPPIKYDYAPLPSLTRQRKAQLDSVFGFTGQPGPRSVSPQPLSNRITSTAGKYTKRASTISKNFYESLRNRMAGMLPLPDTKISHSKKARSPSPPPPPKYGGKRKTKRRNNKPKKNNRKSKKAKAIHKNMKRSRSKTRKMKKTSSRK